VLLVPWEHHKVAGEDIAAPAAIVPTLRPRGLHEAPDVPVRNLWGKAFASSLLNRTRPYHGRVFLLVKENLYHYSPAGDRSAARLFPCCAVVQMQGCLHDACVILKVTEDGEKKKGDISNTVRMISINARRLIWF
jgi:hypothetical protein